MHISLLNAILHHNSILSTLYEKYVFLLPQLRALRAKID